MIFSKQMPDILEVLKWNRELREGSIIEEARQFCEQFLSPTIFMLLYVHKMYIGPLSSGSRGNNALLSPRYYRIPDQYFKRWSSTSYSEYDRRRSTDLIQIGEDEVPEDLKKIMESEIMFGIKVKHIFGGGTPRDYLCNNGVSRENYPVDGVTFNVDTESNIEPSPIRVTLNVRPLAADEDQAPDDADDFDDFLDEADWDIN